MTERVQFRSWGTYRDIYPQLDQCELGLHVSVSMELSASVASQIRIEIGAEVLCYCDSISRVHSLDFAGIE